MLTSLSIKNYALIRELELKPSPHLNVITGETGAGKSILLGAIGLLLGNRADVKTLWNENEKCVIEGVIDVSNYNLKTVFEDENLDFENHSAFRREINPQGKSRAFINDTPVTLEVMKKIGTRLIDIHSQHETLELSKHQFQLNLIDSFADNTNEKEEYQRAWENFSSCKKNLETLMVESNSLQQEADFVKFQLDELNKVNLIVNEQELLESELKMLEHAEDIKSKLVSILQKLNDSEFSTMYSIESIKNEFQSIATYSKEFELLLTRIESIRIELNDILDETERANEKTEFDPKRTEQVNERLSVIYHLQQKHRATNIAALLDLQQSLQTRFDKATNIDEAVALAKKEFTQSEDQLKKNAEKLSATRSKIFDPLCGQLTKLLKELGISDAQMKIVNEKIAPSASGIDRIEILFSANKGIAPKSLAQVASGGEFSRVMFSIKHILAEKKSLPTLILDEIDTGVSGEVAIRLGNRMKEMAQRHQVIAISHLPQIAAKADTHYYVYKDSTSVKAESQIKKLNEKDRIIELAKMIGGEKPSALNLENAKELMER